jgi:transcriptional regulator with XRE-family HTH domain
MSRLNDDALGVTDQRRVFRDRLVARMREINLRAADVARKAQVSKDSLSAYVTMRALPSKASLDKIAKALKCKPSDLLPPGQVDSTVMELRESSKPGYKVLIIRAPLPTEIAVTLFQQAAEHCKPGGGNGRETED